MLQMPITFFPLIPTPQSAISKAFNISVALIPGASNISVKICFKASNISVALIPEAFNISVGCSSSAAFNIFLPKFLKHLISSKNCYTNGHSISHN
jgi:hypothetical protein